MELYQASREWATRPSDERFTSLRALAAFASAMRKGSKRIEVSNRDLKCVPSATDMMDFAILGPNGHPAELTHWSFGQLCERTGVPRDYVVRSGMPGCLTADNVNWGLTNRRAEGLSVLVRRAPNGRVFLGAINGPNYGPVWDSEIADTLVREFPSESGWTVPGTFGKKLDEVTKENTTLYASDRDMWVFLADEEHRVEVHNRRTTGGVAQTGGLARGFFLSNSEVGARTLSLGMFLFDYVCCNRIVWGAQGVKEINIRHTKGAPYRWLEEIRPMLRELSQGSAKPIEESVKAAQAAKIKGDVETFLKGRFGTATGGIMLLHEKEEGRPIETMWDAVVGATAFAKGIEWQDQRVAIERSAGELLSPIGRVREFAI